MPAIQLKPWSATTMTVSVTSAAKPQKTRSIRKAMLRQRTEKNEWLESPEAVWKLCCSWSERIFSSVLIFCRGIIFLAALTGYGADCTDLRIIMHFRRKFRGVGGCLRLHRVDHGGDTHQVHHTGHVVSQHMQRHLCGNVFQRSHFEVCGSHP